MSAPKKTTGVSTLPQEILMEILYKLPAKSLVRFRPNGDVDVCNVSTRQHEVSSLTYVLFLKSALLEVGGRLAIVLVHVLDLLRGGEGLCYMDVWTWEKYKKCWEKITITIPLEWSRIIYNAQWMRFATNHGGKIVLLKALPLSTILRDENTALKQKGEGKLGKLDKRIAISLNQKLSYL
nr:putative F-box protein At3g52320 [Ipomoea batatas]